LAPQPNKTKLPLQDLAVAKENSEKIKVWDEAHDGYIELVLLLNTNLATCISHCVFHISLWHLGWSLAHCLFLCNNSFNFIVLISMANSQFFSGKFIVLHVSL
jgi:hypothetical protein